MVFNNCLFVGLNTISAISNVDGLMFIDWRFPLRKQETIKPKASQITMYIEIKYDFMRKQ